MKKYKTGDVVKLKPYEEKFKNEHPKVVSDMKSFFGKKHEIESIFIGNSSHLKTFKIKGSRYGWSFDWIDDGVNLPDELFQM